MSTENILYPGSSHAKALQCEFMTDMAQPWQGSQNGWNERERRRGRWEEARDVMGKYQEGCNLRTRHLLVLDWAYNAVRREPPLGLN